MVAIKLEYIWIGGSGELRSKTKVVNRDQPVESADELSEWNYDGSSTGQAPGDDSEVMIRPCAIFPDPFRGAPHLLVLCDTWLPNGEPHPTNTRVHAKARFDQALELKPWFGIEQEFFMIDVNTGLPLGVPTGASVPRAQGPYYCSIGAGNCYGRDFAEQALENCVRAGVSVTGMNFEVAPGQCEIQVCDEGITAGDHVTILRYILGRTGEAYGVAIDLQAKPMEGDWNGSGCHTNYSTEPMRNQENGYELIMEAVEKLSKKHQEHLAVYGEGNEKRLTGLHETSSMDEFSCGVANRGCSVRIPRDTERNGRGYMEDRRPSSCMDPYQVTSMLFQTTALE